MLRKIACFCLLLVLTACTLAPDETPAPKTICPTCAATQPCPTCAACTAAAQPTLTFTPVPSATSLPTDTPVPPPTSTPAPTQPPVFSFQVQAGTPSLLQNFAHPDLACHWLGTAGQVFAADGRPAVNVVVVVTGTINGQPFESIGLTGSAPAYGPGGFEIPLTDQPFNSQGLLSIQLFDLTGTPVSDAVSFNTISDCKKNLVLVNFIQPAQ